MNFTRAVYFASIFNSLVKRPAIWLFFYIGTWAWCKYKFLGHIQNQSKVYVGEFCLVMQITGGITSSKLIFKFSIKTGNNLLAVLIFNHHYSLFALLFGCLNKFFFFFVILLIEDTHSTFFCLNNKKKFF